MTITQERSHWGATHSCARVLLTTATIGKITSGEATLLCWDKKTPSIKSHETLLSVSSFMVYRYYSQFVCSTFKFKNTIFNRIILACMFYLYVEVF